jgi:threonine/homoserine/homoserine lactone efflux protein
MNSYLFLKSLIIGSSIAAPVGPIGVLCIRRTLAHGRISGFVSGLGAATADAIYGSIAAFGLTFISMLLINQGIWLRLVGGIFLLILGFKTFFSNPENNPTQNNNLQPGNSLISDYVTTLFLTLTNPLTILSFAAIFTGLGLNLDVSRSFLDALLMVIGIFLGSCTWWFILSGFTGYFRKKMNTATMVWINRLSGIIISGFGIISLVTLIINKNV